MLKPGEEFCEDLQLMRYRDPGKPGTYTVNVYHDLGWEHASAKQDYEDRREGDIPTGPHKAPVVTTTIRLRMPDQRQARKIVEATLKLSTDSNRSWGKPGQPFADFEMLRYPVYLPIMRELAEKADHRALDALGAMAFPEATEALLELTGNKTPAIASTAERLLLARRPGSFFGNQPSRAKYLADRSWRSDLKAKTMQLAWHLLDGEDRESQIRAARIIQSIGDKNDMPKLVEVMDKLLPAYKSNDIEQRAWLRPPHRVRGPQPCRRRVG